MFFGGEKNMYLNIIDKFRGIFLEFEIQNLNLYYF